MIHHRPSPLARDGGAAIWRDGYRAAMVRVETCLLAGDLDRLCFEVTQSLDEKRGRPAKPERRKDSR